jgi:hypothetical protein
VLIVDDGSDEPLHEGDLSSAPLRIIRHEANRGIAAARNTGICAASHDWIAFIDHDDEWTPDKLNRQWPLAASCPDLANTVHFGRCLWNEPAEGKQEIFPGSSIETTMARGGEEALIFLLRQGMTIPFIILLGDRAIFQRFGYLAESVRGGSDDYELVLRLAAGGVRFLSGDFGGHRRYSAVYHIWVQTTTPGAHGFSLKSMSFSGISRGVGRICVSTWHSPLPAAIFAQALFSSGVTSGSPQRRNTSLQSLCGHQACDRASHSWVSVLPTSSRIGRRKIRARIQQGREVSRGLLR